MGVIEWVDGLCPRLHHVLQVSFSKQFPYYSLELANLATQNSIAMLNTGVVHHHLPLQHPTLAEVVNFSFVNGNDEAALWQIANSWRESSKHRPLLQSYPVIGIGFAYDSSRDMLYVTARLGR
jgi:hypothetical protein